MHRFYSLAYLSATAYRLLTTLILIIATVSISSCATKEMPIPEPKTHRSVNARLLTDELTKPIANAIIGIEQSKIGHGQTQELLFDNHEFSELLTPKVQRIEEKMNASLPDLPKQPHWQIRSILKANQTKQAVTEQRLLITLQAPDHSNTPNTSKPLPKHITLLIDNSASNPLPTLQFHAQLKALNYFIKQQKPEDVVSVITLAGKGEFIVLADEVSRFNYHQVEQIKQQPQAINRALLQRLIDLHKPPSAQHSNHLIVLTNGNFAPFIPKSTTFIDQQNSISFIINHNQGNGINNSLDLYLTAKYLAQQHSANLVAFNNTQFASLLQQWLINDWPEIINIYANHAQLNLHAIAPNIELQRIENAQYQNELGSFKQQRLAYNQAIHLIFALKNSETSELTAEQLQGLIAEIEVRTALHNVRLPVRIDN